VNLAAGSNFGGRSFYKIKSAIPGVIAVSRMANHQNHISNQVNAQTASTQRIFPFKFLTAASHREDRCPEESGSSDSVKMA
jgi:hypothetical protein